MRTTNLKKEMGKKVADIAKKIATVEVNSACPLIAFQPKLPIGAEKLRKF